MINRALVNVVVTAPLLLVACGDARYRDISSNSEQTSVVGQVCEVVTDLRAHGISLSQEREKSTDYISIWNPGFTGPEMTFLVILSAGTKFQVLAARECSNCPFDRRLQYQAKVDPEPEEFAGKPAFVQAESMLARYVIYSNGNAA